MLLQKMLLYLLRTSGQFAFLVVPIVILTIVAIACARNLARARRAAFLRSISFVVRRNLPLVSSVFTASVGERASLRLPLRRLSHLLELGLPLSDAIAIVWPTCPRVDQTMLQAAEQSGTLPDAIAVIDAKYQQEFESRIDDDRQSDVILSITFVVLLLCISLAGILFVPSLVIIFEDFGIAPPVFFREIFMSGPLVGEFPTTWYGYLYQGVITIVLVLVSLFLASSLLAGQFRRTDAFNNIVDSLRWAIPVLRRAAMAEACIATLPTIRITTSAGWPLTRAIDLAATVKTNVIWRQHLQDWANAIRRGTETIAAGKSAGLPDILLRYLAVGIRDADLEAPLYAAEQYFILLLDRQRRALRLAFSIGATLVTGALVCGLCVAVIMSLVNVLDAVCVQWWVI